MNSRLKCCLHILLGSACAVASFACVVAAWHETEVKKGFRADPEVRDVGILKQQDERDVTFNLINSTDGSVEITHISTSCTCTQAKTAERNLQPGESTKLTARLHTGSHRGQIAALVSVLYRVGDEQSLQRLSLTMTATVDPHYAVTPEDIFLGQSGDRGEDFRSEANVAITPNSGPPVRVLKAHSTHPAVQVETIAPDLETGSTKIRLTFDPSRCASSFAKAEVIVHTDSNMEPIHRVPVRVASGRTR